MCGARCNNIGGTISSLFVLFISRVNKKVADLPEILSSFSVLWYWFLRIVRKINQSTRLWCSKLRSERCRSVLERCEWEENGNYRNATVPGIMGTHIAQTGAYCTEVANVRQRRKTASDVARSERCAKLSNVAQTERYHSDRSTFP